MLELQKVTSIKLLLKWLLGISPDAGIKHILFLELPLTLFCLCVTRDVELTDNNG